MELAKRDKNQLAGILLGRMHHLREVRNCYQQISANLNYDLNKNYFIVNIANVYVRYMVLELHAQTQLILKDLKLNTDIDKCNEIDEKYRNVRNDIAHVSRNSPETNSIKLDELFDDIDSMEKFGRKSIAEYLGQKTAAVGEGIDILPAIQPDINELKQVPLFKNG